MLLKLWPKEGLIQVGCNGDRDIPEVHRNTMEDRWRGRPVHGMHQKYLTVDVAMFERAHNLKRLTPDFLRILMLPDFIYLPI
jgi:hypothetical protein